MRDPIEPRRAPAALRHRLRSRPVALLVLFAACTVTGACTGSSGTPPREYGLGRPVSEAALAAWNIDVAPDGHGLPAGSGNVVRGREVYAGHCAMCHGANGEGGVGDPLVGGAGTLSATRPRKTVGSYWPYATTLFDYIRRAMPYDAPGSLDANDVYAVSAFLLARNGIVPADATLDAVTLPRVQMPNRDGFVPDPRPGRL